MKNYYFLKDKIRICESVSHHKCGSLGIHIDPRNHYATIHLLWWTILIGDTKFASSNNPEFAKELNALHDKYIEDQEKLLKKYDQHWITL